MNQIKCPRCGDYNTPGTRADSFKKWYRCQRCLFECLLAELAYYVKKQV